MKKLHQFSFVNLIQKSFTYTLYVFIFTVIISFANLAKGQDEEEIEKVKKTLFEYIDAMLKSDTLTMKNILLDKHVFIGYDGTQPPKNRLLPHLHQVRIN